MSSVGNVSNFGGPSAAAPISGGQLTPDGMMLYCASQMRFLDEGIQAHMTKQNLAHTIANKLNDLKTELGKSSMGWNDANAKSRVVDAFEAAFAAIPPGDTAMRDKLNDAFHEFCTDAYGEDNHAIGNAYNLGYLGPDQRTDLNAKATANNAGNGVIGDDLKRYSAAIDALSTDLGKGAELDMINLQSLVSQRQMAVQLTTQIISKINDGYMAIAGQIGK